MSNLFEPVAIVGLACRLPGASDAEQFWANLRTGREGLRQRSDEELLAAGVPEAMLRDPNYVKVNGDIADLDMFDARFFGMTPREATLCDPQLRIFLETAHAAVENAGYDPAALRDVAVYAGTGHSLYLEHNLRSDAATSAGARDLQAGVFNYPDYLATLVSYKLNFKGPSMTVLTACSSSLLTLHLGIQALHSGDCDMALIGGTEVEMRGHGYRWSSGGPLSRDGHCRPFDAAASGTVFTTGVGVVALKRLSDALRDGDHVRAVVRGTAVNNDGADKVGFTAPSVSGQTEVIMEALSIAELEPEAIDYVEAHGTGTPIGDPMEFAALNEAFRRSAGGRDLPTGYCGLGSVKSGIGHLGHASGVASLIKVALCLEHELLAPTLNITEPNPKLDLDSSPFYLATEARSWQRRTDRPRVAGVSSLGFGGTNVHAILQEAPVRPAAPVAVERPRLVIWSAAVDAAEHTYRGTLADHLPHCDAQAFADTVATLQEGRTEHRVRAAMVADTAEQAVAVLTAGTATGRAGRIVRGERRAKPRPVAFLFPGQGSQHARMAAGLYDSEPAFAAAFDECLRLLESAGSDIGTVWRDGDDAALQHTAMAQQSLFAVEYALAQLWQSWGVRPAALLGHSVGELAAAAVAGVFPLADAARLVVARAGAMAAMPAGAMLAVRAAAADVAGLLPDDVVVAVDGGPKQTVVSGPHDAVAEAARIMAGRRIAAHPLRTSHAFHSPMMMPAVDRFAGAFAGVESSAPAIPVYSAATATPLTEAQARQPRFWAEQLTNPVRFGPALEQLLGEQEWVLLEVGPEQALTSLVRGHPEVVSGRHLAVPSLPKRGAAAVEDARVALTSLGTLWTQGQPVTWPALRQGEPLRRVPVPGYQYQRQRYWAEPASRPEQAATQPAEAPAATASTGGGAVAGPFTTLGWVEQPPPARGERRQGTALVLVPAARDIALPLVSALQQAGLRIVPVRPGDGYKEDGVGFAVRPGSRTDLERVLGALRDRETSIEFLVHAWTLDDAPAGGADETADRLGVSFDSLLDLVQLGIRGAHGDGLPGVLVVTTRSVDVSGGEPFDPVNAALHGVARTLPLEDPRVRCRLIDVGVGVDEADLVAEIRADEPTGIVAVRRGRRWVRMERPYAPVPAGHPVLRHNGVYLITGGLGGLGRETARGLARTGLRPRLALVGRDAPDADDAARLTAELEELGAEVRIVAADVADARAMRRVLDTLTARWGPVNGVFHLAGVPGDRMLLLRDKADAAAVLRPKVLGTTLLQELFADRPPLDLFVLFSSRAAVDGLVGSGDYATANAFLDAYAATRPGWLSVGWPSWRTVGMAARARTGRTPATTNARRWETVLDAEEYPFLTEHRVGPDHRAVLPGAGSLDLVVQAFGADAGTTLQLREVVFSRPVAGSCRVVITFEPVDGHWRFTLRSSPVAGGAEVSHVSGTIGIVEAPARTVDLDAIRDRLPERAELPALTGPNRLFNLGPRWGNIREVHVGQGAVDTEKLLTIELPEQFRTDLDGHPLHPSQLDSATAYVRDPDRDGLCLPFMYRSMLLFDRLPAVLYSHIRRRPAHDGLVLADVDLIAPDGRVVAAAEGFTMRRVPEGFVADLDTPGEPDRSGAGTQQVAAGHGTTGEPSSGLDPAVGIEPEVGVDLLLRLLDARPPGHVVVRPFRDGRPVPLPTDRLATPTVSPVGAPDRAAGREVGQAAAGPEVRPTPVRSAPDAGGVESTPGDARERLRQLWVAALGVTDIAADDDFFDLGGDSLAAIDLVSRIGTAFGTEISIATLFDYPTLDALATAIVEQAG